MIAYIYIHIYYLPIVKQRIHLITANIKDNLKIFQKLYLIFQTRNSMGHRSDRTDQDILVFGNV